MNSALAHDIAGSRRRSLWALLGVVALGLAIAGQRRLEVREYALDGVLLLGVAVAAFVLSVAHQSESIPKQLWPRRASLGDDPADITLLDRNLQVLLLSFVALLGVIAFASLADNQFTLRGVLCWLGALLAWLLATVQVSHRPLQIRIPNRAALEAFLRQGGLVLRGSWVALLLAGIVLVSLFFHVYRIDATPAEPQSDHVEASEDVRSILNGDHMIFFPRNTGREATQFYLTALMSKVFGYGFTTLKLTMALVGALNVIPMYLLGKELLDRRFGLLTALLMSMSYWHIIVSRIGWRIVLAPFWTTVTLYFLLRAFRSGRRNDYLWTGLALGAGLYGYMSFRVTPVLIVALMVLKALVDRGSAFDWRRYATNGALLVATSMLVYLPMFRYMYDEPRMLWYRVLTRTTDLERTVEQSAVEVFANNVKRGLLMFNWEGDGAWTASVPSRPALDYVMGGLFVLGAAYLLYLLMRGRRTVALYLAVAVFVLLLPSTLAIAFPIENPSNIRASGVIPVVIVLVGLPLYVVAQQAINTLRGGPGLILVAVVGALLLGQAARLNYGLYYVEYDQQYRRAAWNAFDMARVMQGFANSVGDIYDTYIIGTAYWVDHRAVALSLRNMEWNNLIMDMNQAQPHLAEPKNRLYIFNVSNTEAERWLKENYPNGRLMRFRASLPDKDFNIFLAPAQF
jgi:hypothetical protein